MKRFAVSARSHLLFYLLALFTSIIIVSPANGQSIRVVILGVAEHTDSTLKNYELDKSIKQSALDLENYFLQRFPNNAKIYRFVGKDSTSTNFLKTFFEKMDIGKKGDLNLWFIMSHGKVASKINDDFPSDLFVAASNSVKASSENWMRFSTDIFTYITKADKGTINLVFLETCYSQQADTKNIQIATAQLEKYRMKFMLICSSVKDKKSYKTTFTKALLDIWQNQSAGQDCTTTEVMPATIRAKMEESDETLKDDEGISKVIVPYKGVLCLETFSNHNSLLLLTNFADKPIKYRIYSVDNKPLYQPDDLDVDETTAIRLDSKKFVVRVIENGVTKQDIPIDFTEKRFFNHWFGSTTDFLKISKVYYKGANQILDSGLDENLALSMKETAYSFSRLAGSSKYSSELALEIKEGLYSTYLRTAEQTAFQPFKNVVKLLNNKKLSSAVVADYLKLEGDYENAAKLYLNVANAATKSDDVTNANLYNFKAYNALLATGDIIKAKSLRTSGVSKTLNSCDKCPILEEKILGDPLNLDIAKKIRIINTVENLSHNHLGLTQPLRVSEITF